MSEQDTAATSAAENSSDGVASPAGEASQATASFAANLKQLPKVSHLAAMQLLDAQAAVVATIENKAGSTGSLAVYNHLAQLYGAINAEAARKGLEIFAEHTKSARAHPGKHPNIDRLLQLLESGETLRVKQIFAPLD